MCSIGSAYRKSARAVPESHPFPDAAAALRELISALGLTLGSRSGGLSESANERFLRPGYLRS